MLRELAFDVFARDCRCGEDAGGRRATRNLGDGEKWPIGQTFMRFELGGPAIGHTELAWPTARLCNPLRKGAGDETTSISGLARGLRCQLR